MLASFAAADNVKYANQMLVPEESGKPASVTLKLASPYIISGRSIGVAEGSDKIEVSTNAGKTFKRVKIDQIGTAAKGKLEAWVRITFSKALRSLNLSVDVQNNPGALPYLSPGKNIVSVGALQPKALGDNRLVVTYAYRLGSRGKSFDELCEEGKEIAKQHNAKWSDTITAAQKVFTAKDLPGTLEIDCPTPKGEYPVYPRMLFLRREVISPTATPLPLPTGAIAATAAAADELQTLPNPYLIGSEPPTPIKPLAMKRTKIPLIYVQFCDEKGEVSAAGSLAWPKVVSENGKVIRGAVVYGGDLQHLPSSHDLVAARLVFPVLAGHDKASEKVGVVFLKEPVEKGRALEFNALGDDRVTGTTVVPMQPSGTPKYDPAKPFTIDVTSAVRAIASHKAKSSGIALRIVPDRGIDDGWTVRCQVSPTEPAYLELDIKTDTGASPTGSK